MRVVCYVCGRWHHCVLFDAAGYRREPRFGDRRGMIPSSDVGPKFAGDVGSSPTNCQLIVVDVDGRQRVYAENIRMRLTSNGLTVELMPVRGGAVDMNAVLASAVQDAVRQRSLFACIINEQNEMHRSMTVNILHGQLQEHRNMPLESALSLILRHYEEWFANNGDPARSTDASEPRQPGRHGPPADFKRPDDNVVQMLQLVLDGRCLVVEELDEVIAYFQQQRSVMAKAQGVAPVSKSATSGTVGATVNEGDRGQRDDRGGQRDLQDQIMQMIEKAPSANAAKTVQMGAADSSSEYRKPSRFADEAPPGAREIPDQRPGGFAGGPTRPLGPTDSRGGSFHGYGQTSSSPALAPPGIGDFRGLQDKMQSLYPGSQLPGGVGPETHESPPQPFSQPAPGGMGGYARPPPTSSPQGGFGMGGPHWAGATPIGASNGRQDWRAGFNRPDYHNPMQQPQRLAGNWQSDGMPFGRFH